MFTDAVAALLDETDRLVLLAAVYRLALHDDERCTEASGLLVPPQRVLWKKRANSTRSGVTNSAATASERFRLRLSATPEPGIPHGSKDVPATWLPPADTAHCTYGADWTATKLGWGLTADDKERAALLELAEAGPDTTVQFDVAK
ncbi:hypothetical protein [Streptomyces sp. NPDC086010]|uniref:hypothetical protein n=1 Tax=Streptomyces sp. NPDC086010 TaxID=3365745 RepID=UPI0037D7014A